MINKINVNVFVDNIYSGLEELVQRFDEEYVIPKMREQMYRWRTRRDTNIHTSIPTWVPELSAKQTEFSKEVVKNEVGHITCNVGLDPSALEDYEMERGRVIAYGSGYNYALGSNGPLMTKTKGEQAWNETLTAQYAVQTNWRSRPTPDTWNDMGYDFVNETVEQLQFMFQDYVNANIQQIASNALQAALSAK